MMALLPQEESIWFILIGQISKMKTILEFLEVFLSKWYIPSYFQICKELRASETWGECSAHMSWYPIILSKHLNTKCSQSNQGLTYSNRKQYIPLHTIKQLHTTQHHPFSKNILCLTTLSYTHFTLAGWHSGKLNWTIAFIQTCPVC